MKAVSMFPGLALCAVLTACGGGGGSGSATPVTPTTPTTPATPSLSDFGRGVFPASETFAGLCLSPRTGSNPLTGVPWNDRQGTVSDENYFLRSWSNELYLWYDEIVDRDPALYSNPVAYFNTLKTNNLTQTGKPKDSFHFVQLTDDFLLESQAGISVGFGLDLSFERLEVPRSILVNFVEPGSAADRAGIRRGWKLTGISGVDIVNGTDDTLDFLVEALFPQTENHAGNYEWVDTNNLSDPPVYINTFLSAEVISINPVFDARVLSTGTGNVGYLVFNNHGAQAEKQLVQEFADFRSAGVTDLILDMRYNGGGYLAIASQLAYMIAGPSITQNKTFERTAFNDKHPFVNPVTGDALAPTPFYSSTLGFSLAEGSPLPDLGLRRVFVLSTENTCSASESVINGLRGVGVEVILIGDTTCGKPYGYYPEDNCGITYFSIQIRGENDLGFGDFADGFSPQNTPADAGVLLPGCAVADDFGHELGDTNEGLLKAALDYRLLGSCPSVPGVISRYSSLPVSETTLNQAQGMAVSTATPFAASNKLLGLPR